MENIIERYFDEILVIFFLIVGLTAFFTIQSSLTRLQISYESDTHVFQEVKKGRPYDHSLSGSEVIRSVRNNKTSVIYHIFDNARPRNLVLSITDCADLSSLAAVDETARYSPDYTYTGDVITRVDYLRE